MIRNSLIIGLFTVFIGLNALAENPNDLMARIGSDSIFSNPEVAKAMNQLIALGEPAVESIINKINDPKTPIQQQWYLARVLGKIKSPKAIPGLILNLKSTDNNSQRISVTSALIEIGETATTPLLAVIRSELANLDSTKVVNYPTAYIAYALGHLQAKEGKKDIHELLAKEFAYSLNRNGRWGATPHIKEMLMESLVRLEATESISLIEEMIAKDQDVNSGAAQEIKVKFGYILNGKNPFVIYMPLGSINPNRIYISTYSGGGRTDSDAETGETIQYKIIAAGSVAK